MYSAIILTECLDPTHPSCHLSNWYLGDKHTDNARFAESSAVWVEGNSRRVASIMVRGTPSFKILPIAVEMLLQRCLQQVQVQESWIALHNSLSVFVRWWIICTMHVCLQCFVTCGHILFIFVKYQHFSSYNIVIFVCYSSYWSWQLKIHSCLTLSFCGLVAHAWILNTVCLFNLVRAARGTRLELLFAHSLVYILPQSCISICPHVAMIVTFTFHSCDCSILIVIIAESN